MAQYSIGEIEQLTGVKPYVLRYWEEVIPVLSPKKDLSGRRIYSQRELDIVQRLKYLIYTKLYTIDGARAQIIQETAVSDSNAAAMEAIHEIRKDLSNIFLLIKRNKERREASERQKQVKLNEKANRENRT